MSLLESEHNLIERIDKRLELESQLMQSIQRLFDIYNRSFENEEDNTK